MNLGTIKRFPNYHGVTTARLSEPSQQKYPSLRRLRNRRNRRKESVRRLRNLQRHPRLQRHPSLRRVMTRQHLNRSTTGQIFSHQHLPMARLRHHHPPSERLHRQRNQQGLQQWSHRALYHLQSPVALKFRAMIWKSVDATNQMHAVINHFNEAKISDYAS